MTDEKSYIPFTVSKETYHKMLEVVYVRDSPFTTISEYIETLILHDLAIRDNGGAINYVENVKQALQSPEVKKMVKDLIKERSE